MLSLSSLSSVDACCKWLLRPRDPGNGINWQLVREIGTFSGSQSLRSHLQQASTVSNHDNDSITVQFGDFKDEAAQRPIEPNVTDLSITSGSIGPRADLSWKSPNWAVMLSLSSLSSVDACCRWLLRFRDPGNGSNWQLLREICTFLWGDKDF